MDMLRVPFLFWYCFPANALFTVESIQPIYTAEYGGEVTMECSFTVTANTNIDQMNVIWKHDSEKRNGVEVAKFLNGKNVDILQDEEYRGRVKLLSQQLKDGHAILHITNVKMIDAGQYLCIISSQGSDYKMINLAVEAPYKKIHSKVVDLVTSSGQIIKEISCQSVGYPKPEIKWLSSHGNFSDAYNTSYVLTADRLFDVTSVIRIPSDANGSFTCIFWNKAPYNATSLTITLPEPISYDAQRQWIFGAAAFTLLLILLVFFIHGYYKGKKKNATPYDSVENCVSANYTGYNSEHDIFGNT